MIFSINVDTSAIEDLLKVPDAIQQQAQVFGSALAEAAKNHLIEGAQQKLHSSRKIYIDGLSTHQLDENTWVVSLEASAVWAEVGMHRHNMLDDILSSPKAKTNKKGGKYLSVPFKHGGPPSSSTPAQRNLNQTIAKVMKGFGISPTKIERHDNGSPKLGTLHTFDIPKPNKTHEGVGQGQGPIGAPIQGHTGIPYLQNLKVIQRMVTNTAGDESVQRDLVTFRMASSSQQGKGMWDHPGTPGAQLFPETEQFIKDTWSKMAPDFVKAVLTSI